MYFPELNFNIFFSFVKQIFLTWLLNIMPTNLIDLLSNLTGVPSDQRKASINLINYLSLDWYAYKLHINDYLFYWFAWLLCLLPWLMCLLTWWMCLLTGLMCLLTGLMYLRTRGKFLLTWLVCWLTQLANILVWLFININIHIN